MNLFTLLAMLRRTWPIIALVGILGAGAGFAAGALPAARYTATSQIFAATSFDASASELAAGSNYMKLQIKSYPAVITSPEVLRAVGADVGVASTTDLARRITVDQPVDSMWLNLTVTDSDRDRASKTAAVLARHASTAIQNLEARGSGASPVTMTVVDNAGVPASEVARKTKLYVVGGGVGGLLLSLLAVLTLGAFREIRRQSTSSQQEAPTATSPTESSVDAEPTD